MTVNAKVVPSDIEIEAAELLPIVEIAAKLGLTEDDPTCTASTRLKCILMF
jgi:hypothetical protein